MDILGDGVLKFIACRATVDGEVPDDSPIEALCDDNVSCGSCRGRATQSDMTRIWSWYADLTRPLVPYTRGLHGEVEGLEQLAFQMSALAERDIRPIIWIMFADVDDVSVWQCI